MQANISFNRYFYLWSLVMFPTSVLLVPSVQGTTPGFLMAFLSIIVVLFFADNKVEIIKYSRDVTFYVFIFIMTMFLSQLALASSQQFSFSGVTLVNPTDTKFLFKSSMFTQSLYMIACILAFIFVKNFYTKSWDKFLMYGGLVLALYGLYEFFYFLIYGTSGDFLTNRFYGDGNFLGSAFQIINLLGVEIMRLKSLTGEASMYALTMLPIFIYSVYLNKKIFSFIFGVTLILSTSTTFIIGMIILGIFGLKKLFIILKKSYFTLFIFFISIALLLASIYFFNIDSMIKNIIQTLLIDKITMQDNSGSQRSMFFMNHLNFYFDLPLINQIFGVGFGYVRSTDLFTTLLVNSGVVGLILFVLLFSYPIFILGNERQSKFLKIILIVIIISLFISVPEFSYLSNWIFLGISYNKITNESKRRKRSLD